MPQNLGGLRGVGRVVAVVDHRDAIDSPRAFLEPARDARVVRERLDGRDERLDR